MMELAFDPISRKLARAPVEDEEIGAEEESAVAEAHEWRRHNEPVSHEELLAELGLTMADFDRMAQMPLAEEPNGPRPWRR